MRPSNSNARIELRIGFQLHTYTRRIIAVCALGVAYKRHDRRSNGGVKAWYGDRIGQNRRK